MKISFEGPGVSEFEFSQLVGRFRELRVLDTAQGLKVWNLMSSNPADWIVKARVRLTAEERSGNMKDLNILSLMMSLELKIM